jgi:hypothetical protein
VPPRLTNLNKPNKTSSFTSRNCNNGLTPYIPDFLVVIAVWSTAIWNMPRGFAIRRDEELMDRLKAYVAEQTRETFFGQDQAEETEDSI